MILGLDPSLRNFGWVLMTDDGEYMDKGMMGTDTDMIFVDRYISLRDGLREVIQKCRLDHPAEVLRVGIESPIFNDLYSEGMYGLFLYSNEALKLEKVDTVFLTPNQVKAHAQVALGRPKGWKMQKADMVEAAKKATDGQGAKAWNHHQADAYWVGYTASRFWKLVNEEIDISELSELEVKHFTSLEKYVQGKKAGRIKRMGITYKEDDRFFRWSEGSGGAT
jgi:Holliday junction resolvasome RuvABC endonuclease subunit